MKNVLLIAFVLIGFSIQAQIINNGFRWYNPVETIDNLVGNIGTSSTEYLFPDTTIKIVENGQIRKPNIHGIAIELDPQSGWFDTSDPNIMDIHSWDNYYFDSINIKGVYTRNLHSSIVDTLIIQYRISPKTVLFWDSANYPWVFNNHMTDSIWFHPIYYNKQSPFMADSVLGIIKIPLRESDSTCTSGKPKVIGDFFASPECATYITANNTLQFVVSFKPGYTWIANQDTLDKMNSFQFVSYEENGDNGGTGTFPYSVEGDWTMSSILDSDNLYDTNNAMGFGNIYIASLYYPIEYKYEHHYISFLLSSEHYYHTHLKDTVWLKKNGGDFTFRKRFDSLVLSDQSWIDPSIKCENVQLKYLHNPSFKDRTSTLHLYKTYDPSYHEQILFIQPKHGWTNTNTQSKIIIIQSFYPNPTNGNSFLEFNLQKTENVILSIYSADGQLIQTISEKGTIGKQSIEIQSSTLSSGLYFYKLQAGEESGFGKFIKH